MPDLIAQGRQPEHRWRRHLEPGARHIIGRQALDWSTPWDERISRQHAEVVYQNGRLVVTRLESARNPVFFQGQRADHFALLPGEHFVIGETTFSLADERVLVSLDLPRPDHEQTFAVDELHRQPFREADKRIDALSRLPQIINAAASDQELFVQLVNLLLIGVERATAAAVVMVQGPPTPVAGILSEFRDQESANPKSKIQNLKSDDVQVLHWDRRGLSDRSFRPSEHLIRQAVSGGQSVAHVWGGAPNRSGAASQFTLSEGIDWAICTPVQGVGSEGWALYVTGSFAAEVGARPRDAEALRDDVKFAELTAATLAGLRQSRLLAARQASLSQFFSPVVLEAIGSEDPDKVLAPREADVAVLFCDLQGFTRESERLARDLFTLLDRVSQALGVMTHQILAHGGVVGDFHGDAAMGFWGWPIEQPDAALRACRAALAIRNAFLAGAAADFRVGIGIASGRVVAGKIGTADQVKVTAFGPVVNRAARLETLTRRIRAEILLDTDTAAAIRAGLPADVCHVRRIARIQPAGLNSPIDVSELVPCGALSSEQIASYEAAVEAFEAGKWREALERLQSLAGNEPGKEFFVAKLISRHNGTPPPNWDGVIRLEEK